MMHTVTDTHQAPTDAGIELEHAVQSYREIIGQIGDHGEATYLADLAAFHQARVALHAAVEAYALAV